MELTSSRMAYLKMLSLLMGEVLSTETVLEKPVPQNELSAVSEIPPTGLLSWFDAQGAGLQDTRESLECAPSSSFRIVCAGAYGNPGLNMLKNEFFSLLYCRYPAFHGISGVCIH